MPTNTTRRLTYGAIMIALFLVLLAVSFYVPVIGILTTFLVPLPLVYYTSKFDRTFSILTAIVAVIVSFLMGGFIVMAFAFPYAAIGVAMGDGLRERKSKLFIFLASGITFMIAVVIEYTISVLVQNFNPIQNILDETEAFYRTNGQLLEKYGVRPENYTELVDQSIQMMHVIIPFVVILTIFLTTWIIMQINFFGMRKLRVKTPKFPRFSEFRLPKSVVWYYLIVLIFTLFVKMDEGTMLFLAIANAMVLLRGLLFLQGLSLIYFYIDRIKQGLWLKVIATILAVPLMQFVTLIGIFDLGFNIRAYITNSPKK
ncbi:YybS family protein [Paenisporosarcina cavernae]|uniref:DUF2232 domain-containing protein n=1 Tax=Paenisporosarcina cavernae TaxID=2320858 RepID=A0A385YP92_9BACL|nr:YybS family protein [Paenisporosarcina cavernae]AYC28396.1 DUF2232 domain-containing protein [Paenisporosarcina cavernae]